METADKATANAGARLRYCQVLFIVLFPFVSSLLTTFSRNGASEQGFCGHIVHWLADGGIEFLRPVRNRRADS
jgi:hypothetical protein